ncbi:MAG: phosphoenolpyruvate synthase [Candidatus Aenigmatarchaeota archaeon]
MKYKAKRREASYVLPFNKIRRKDVALVGGKTSSLGELFSMKLPVPNGFAITADAYRYFISYNKLDAEIRRIIKDTDVKRIKELKKAGRGIRNLIKSASFPDDLEKQILSSYHALGSRFVAVRSSATAEDLPDASFAGEQESYLNIDEKNLLKRIRDCFASLFTDRAISYREDKKFDHFHVYLSVAVEKQIFSKASGVMFTIDPDSGHRNFIVINSSYGLGDYIVQGRVTPDEFWIFKKNGKIIEKKLGVKNVMEIRSIFGVKQKRVSKGMQKTFSISDKEAEHLAKHAKTIEEHYGCSMDIEWAKDNDNKIYIIQARPVTVHAKQTNIYEEYRIKEKGTLLAEGAAVGRKISTGHVNVIKNVRDMGRFHSGQILVTTVTDPDWEPIMKIASGIVTEEGGRTSHCAIVSRELGIPAIVGVKNATKKLHGLVTVDCSGEKGKIWKNVLKYEKRQHDIKKMPKTHTKVYVNIGEPQEAVDASLLPVDGVGLAREEFIINDAIAEHPLAMIKQGREKIFIDKLAAGIAKIAASFYPRPVTIRFSDFKTNEYRNLKGGEPFEPREENPMIGWRGTSRYISSYEPAFRLELKAINKCEVMGLDNIKIMLPFCRTLGEADKAIKIINSENVKAELGVMAEIPSNVVSAAEFSKRFKFFSIGSNDLTQLTLGIDRDSQMLAKEFDERDPAVKTLIANLIKTAHKHKRTVGICGDAPSSFPDFTEFLVKCKIDSVSVTPDVAVNTRLLVAKAEKRRA